ncbi:cyclophilin-like fold protein [Streptomyces ochraceiscleroticus]|uniref:Cyclophilin-like fold protein n=1 Tax=Streptomyces ochraceiscleroticus TaxID=47761 RepID=A0ABW1MUB0_9ACTN|nr:cyclophilin-like fold protein [Streptomyces ochraceiscleroticus]
MTAISRRAVTASLAAVLGLGLAACTQSSDSGSEGGTSAPSSAASSSISPSADEQEGTPIRIRIGDQTLDATVWDNPTGRALLERLPLTLSFEDLNGEEKVGHLDRELTMDGMPDGDDPQVGDLGYYAPWGNVVLYYGDVGRWDGIARIGHIHGNLSAISDQTGDFTATLEAAK